MAPLQSPADGLLRCICIFPKIKTFQRHFYPPVTTTSNVPTSRTPPGAMVPVLARLAGRTRFIFVDWWAWLFRIACCRAYGAAVSHISPGPLDSGAAWMLIFYLPGSHPFKLDISLVECRQCSDIPARLSIRHQAGWLARQRLYTRSRSEIPLLK